MPLTLRRVLASIVADENSITYSECAFVALGMQHAMRVRHIILSSVACPALQYFSTLSHKRYGFRKKKNIEHKMRLLIFSTTFD